MKLKTLLRICLTPSTVKFAAEIWVLVAQYQSSAAEIAHVCKKKLELRWAGFYTP